MGAKAKIHLIGQLGFSACGRESYARGEFYPWRGVTCRRCLSKKPQGGKRG